MGRHGRTWTVQEGLRFLQISQHPKGLAGIAAYVQVSYVDEPDYPLRIDDKGRALCNAFVFVEDAFVRSRIGASACTTGSAAFQARVQGQEGKNRFSRRRGALTA